MEGMEGVEGSESTSRSPRDQKLDPPHTLHYPPLRPPSIPTPIFNIVIPLHGTVHSLPRCAALRQRREGPAVGRAGAGFCAGDAQPFLIDHEIAESYLAFPSQARNLVAGMRKAGCALVRYLVSSSARREAFRCGEASRTTAPTAAEYALVAPVAPDCAAAFQGFRGCQITTVHPTQIVEQSFRAAIIDLTM